MATVGAVFVPSLPPERLAGIAGAADDAGLSELWLWEDCFREAGFASATAALATTARLRLGIGVLPTPLRNCALTAMEIATVERLFPGRFVPGIGHGVQDWMGQVGARVASPLTLLREQLTALRSLLRGETVTVSGRYVQLDHVALDWPPAAAPPVLAAATGPKTLRVSGECADGTVLSGGTTPAEVAAARTHIDAGRAEAGRTDPHRLVVYVPAATGHDAADRVARTLAAAGLDPAAAGAVWGDAETIAGRLRRWVDAGADTLVLQQTDDEPDPEAFVRFAAEQVAPLLT